jgi:O-antigen/teichoic acid export membrane protein
MLRVICQLSALSVLQILTGVGTSVLSARALGVDGRGDLAAVTAPLGLAGYVFAFGLTTYATRAAARGESPARLLGTLGAASLAIGIIAIGPCLWVASVLAGARHEVRVLLDIGVLVLPLSLFGGLLTNLSMGLERWRAVTRQRLLVVTLPLLVYIVLYSAGELTLVSAALTMILSGFVALVPLAPVLRRSWPPAFDRRLASEGFRYGAIVTPITLSKLMNVMLDQTIMAGVVGPHQLGLYTVAVTAAGLTSTVSGAVGYVAFPRVARAGADAEPARVVRLGILSALLSALVVAAVSPVALPLLYGSAFDPAYPLILVLLVAALPLTGVSMFSTLHTARNKLGLAALSEIVAVVVTIVGLFLLLPVMGAMGAALVSLFAYSTSFLWLLMYAPGNFGGRRRDYLIPRRSDLEELRAQLARRRAALAASEVKSSA